MLEMAHRYRADIISAVREYLNEVGSGMGEPCERDGAMCWGDVVAATAERYSFEQYRHSDEIGPEAKLFGLRFAVEWYAGELAREYCPDL
jgi:hypothetical protein